MHWIQFLLLLASVEVITPAEYNPPGDGNSGEEYYSPVATTTKPPSGCICPLFYRPICGTDGKTYGNECLLGCAEKSNPGLDIAHTGECDECPSGGEEFCLCSMAHDEVCGSNGVTYQNMCYFCCAKKGNPGLTVAHKGACSVCPANGPETCLCSRNYAPVCGSDGITYNNTCLFCCTHRGNQNVTIDHEGECKVVCPDIPIGACTCVNTFDPVCGTDGVTYRNLCEFCCRTRLNNVTIAHRGPCQECPSPPGVPCRCAAIFDPVCGSDGKTYSSFCDLCCETENSGSVTVVHDGPCEDECRSVRCFCPMIPRNGNTTMSPGMPEGTNVPMMTASSGYPAPSSVMRDDGSTPLNPVMNAPTSSGPVCGSDGKTYPGICAICCAQPSSPGLTKIHDGECAEQNEPNQETPMAEQAMASPVAEETQEDYY